MLRGLTRVSYSKITVILLGIFDLYVSCTLLKACTVGLFALACGDFLEHTKSVRVQRLNRAACLVAEVQCPFVGPLRSAFDTAIEAESFSVLRDYLKTAQTTICHNFIQTG